MRLKDKVAIVTGGAHGAGEAAARLFANSRMGPGIGPGSEHANLSEV